MELDAGRGTPIPDYVQIVQEARYWRVPPMEIENWPLIWIKRGQMVRQAESIAHQRQMERRQG